MFAGAALNYTPDQLRKVFDPIKGFVFDTTNRFDLGALEVPSTKSNRSLDALTHLKHSGIDPNSYSGAAFINQYGAPTIAEHLETIIPLYERLEKSRADLADRNAQRKFGQEMLAAGFGSLQKIIS